MPPVQDIARLAKQANPQSVVIVDGAQAAGLYPLNLKSGLIDALIFSGHKSLYGPYGIAGLVLGSAGSLLHYCLAVLVRFRKVSTCLQISPPPMKLAVTISGQWQTHAGLNWLKQTGRAAVTGQILS